MPSGIKRIFATPLTAMDTSAKEELGTIRHEGNKTYKYVNFDAAGAAATVAIVAGDIVYYDDYVNSKVHADFSASEANLVAGQAQAAWAGVSGSPVYGWIQIEGLSAVLPTNVVAGAAGNKLTGVGTADKTLDVSALVSDQHAAILLVATPGSQRVLLTCPR